MLLREYIPFQPGELIKEEARKSLKEGASLIVSGVMQRANAKNQNERVYSKSILEREVKKYLEGPVKEGRAFGELDHPDSQVVEFKNVSHAVKKLWWKGDDLMGEVEIFDTPAGRILKEIICKGYTVGISSRGAGSVQENYEDNTLIVQGDFELICWDFVTNPSTHGAFMGPTGIREGVKTKENKYNQVENIIRDIICENTGVCYLN